MYNVTVTFKNGNIETTTGLISYEYARKTADYWERRKESDGDVLSVKITQD